MILLILFLVFLFGIIGYFSTMFYIVRRGEVIVIERLGSFDRVAKPGLAILYPFEIARRFKWSFLEETASGHVTKNTREDYRIPVEKEILFDPPPVSCTTKDNIFVNVNIVIKYKITNPEKAIYNVEDLHQSLHSDLACIIRESCSEMQINNLISNQTNILAKIINQTNDYENWGIKVTSVKLQNIGLPKSLMEATERSIATEKELEAKRRSEEARRLIVSEEKRHEYELEQLQMKLEKERKEHDLALITSEETAKRNMKINELKQLIELDKTGRVFSYLTHKNYCEALSEMKGERIIVPYESAALMGTLFSLAKKTSVTEIEQ